MKVYEINPENFGKYKHLLSNILHKPNMCGVFSKSCGHCEYMKPEWNKLKSKIMSMPGNGNLIEIDSDVLPYINHSPLRQNVSGYPTIMIIKKGIPKMEYSGNRSYEDMYDFFNKNLAKSNNMNQQRNITIKKKRKLKKRKVERSRKKRSKRSKSN